MNCLCLGLLATVGGCSLGNPEIDDTALEPLFDCEGDNDGVIDADELPWHFGVQIPYLANGEGNNVDVEPDGEDLAGMTTWDFTEAPGALSVDFDLADPEDFWFDEHFSEASYVAPLFAHELDLLGVVQAQDDGFELLGLVSRDENPAHGQTLVVYDVPIEVYQFPLELGTTWSSSSEFDNATIYGVANGGEEEYNFEVDARGSVLLPGFELENVLRLRIEVSQTFAVTAGDNPVLSVRYLYVKECFGELARICSLPGETSLDFDRASEFRVLDIHG
ncbi:MAG: hypothetical protein HN348_00365 [Proteobacteria bacterium]|jgi:hypothetical protein|nr:hypothetical protein [Pseudomonadota bacterium]